MKNTLLLFSLLLMFQGSAFAQYPVSDDEGLAQAAALRKLNAKAECGTHTITREISFSTGKGNGGTPIVLAEEKASIEIVSMKDNASLGYLLPYNQFMKIVDYDFLLTNRGSFKRQKFPPTNVSLTSDDIFLDDNYGQFYGTEAKEEGSRAKFTYDYLYTDAKYLTRIFFHGSMPTGKFVIQFRVPSWLTLDISEKNFGSQYNITKTTRKEKDVTVYTYTASNLTGIRQEPTSLGRPYYLPHLILTVRNFKAGDKVYKGFETVDDMYAWYNFLYKKSINQTDVLRAQVKEITRGKSSDLEKVKSLYYWVQDNIRYIAFEEGYAGFVPMTVQDVYKNKYGDCKGMANLLTEMLRLEGFDAHFAWIGTREIPYDRRQVQSLCVDNHAISVLYLDGKTYFLDGTEKFAPLGKNAYRIQGKSVLVQDGDRFRIEEVPAANIAENVILTKAQLEMKDNLIQGHVVLHFDGESRNVFHNIYNSIPADKRKKFLSRLIELGNSNTESSNVKTSDFTNRDIPLVIEGDIVMANRITQVGNKLYANMDFFPASIVDFTPGEDRQTPYDLDNIFIARDEISLKLPAGIKIDRVPQAVQFSFQSNNMEASYVESGNQITLKKKLEMSSPVIYQRDFPSWNEFLTKIKQYNRSSITMLKSAKP